MNTRSEMMKATLSTTVIVSALGYFVDIYDLLLFGIVRVPSLKELGFVGDEVLNVGLSLINWQMSGMLVGGIVWGILGDKRGRIQVLFGSIFLYSMANIANAYVGEIARVTGLSVFSSYRVLRFAAGVGLAGELGAAITLVSEILPKETRGYGTAIVASVGILGAVVGGAVGDHFHWKTAYIIGGVMGLGLLILRITMFESGLFESLKSQSHVKRGEFKMLFTDYKRFVKYARCILIGVPIWFVIGILVTFAPELSKAVGVTDGTITGAKAIMMAYIGLSTGDFASGFLSQWLGTRKKVVAAFLAGTALFVAVYCFIPISSSAAFFGICIALGFFTGYWAVFVTIASEQFGTNLRATVTTTVPNFVRGSVVPITMTFKYFKEFMPLTIAAFCVGAITLVIAFLALYKMDETYGKDLNFLEVS